MAAGLRVLFCGINPGLWSAAVGHHFARPGNRFWRALHEAGFTERLLDPSEEGALLGAGLGITNLVARSSATARELDRDELRRGATELERTAARWRPRFVAVLGMTAYRQAFDRPRAQLGEQPELLAGARVWLLPNPSGAQATYQLPQLVSAFSSLHQAVREAEGP